MLNLARLTADRGEYYLGVVASGIDEYYTGAGEEAGRWMGAGARRLELFAKVEPEQLRALLAGVDRVSGDRLTGRGRSVAAFDVTLRPPKSVSLLYGLGDPATAAQVRVAHDAAVAATVGFLEEQAAFTRRGRGGAERVPVTGLVAAGFVHRTSRAGDPLLHSHLVIANAAQAVDDGRWRTLDSRALYRSSATAGWVYQAALRAELTQRLGVEWEPVVNGLADIRGVSRHVIRAFSTRRQAIEAALAEQGRSSAAAAQTATLATRPAKDRRASMYQLRLEWTERAEQLGLDAERLAGLTGPGRHVAPGEATVTAAVGVLAGAEGLTAHRSTFSRNDVVRGFIAALPPGVDVSYVGQLTDWFLGSDLAVPVPGRDVTPAATRQVLPQPGHPDVLPGHPDVPPGRTCLVSPQPGHPDVPPAGTSAGEQQEAEGAPPAAAVPVRASDVTPAMTVPTGADARWTTPDMLAVEAAALSCAGRLATTTQAPVVPPPGGDWPLGPPLEPADALAAALGRRPSLTEEQRAVVAGLCGPQRLALLVGPAGTGKTFTLDAARDAWTASGRRVVGAALAARAATALTAGWGIHATTIAGLLGDLEHRPHALPAGGILVIDESSMAGTRDLARVLAAAEDRDVKVVLVGDHRQLSSIDAGGLFATLATRPNALQLTDNRRQQQPWEREALAELRDGDVATALVAYERFGRIARAATADAARTALVTDWHTATSAGNATAMIAARRDDVTDLNQRARTLRAAEGALTGPTIRTAEGRAFQVGDTVVALRNNRRLGLANGTRGTITAVDAYTRDITVVPHGQDTEVVIPATYVDAGHLDLGYAITAHKAQGQTLDAAFVLGSDELYREAGYVALSRGRDTNHLYTVASAALVDHLARDTPQQLATPEHHAAQLLRGINTPAQAIERDDGLSR